ncbi:hypothetical protein [Microbaculum sp. FT89]|uniref:hypothetical protein n=1 Tax=Microbaculum sp. FT89 TaxID=3447298 RepID=UPI003F52EC22
MIVEMVSFEAPEGMSNDDIVADARGVVAHWQANPDLVRKHFVRAADGKLAGIYVWPNKEAALKAHDAAWIARFKDRTGTEPTFAYFDLFMLIDNEAGTVSEFPLP